MAYDVPAHSSIARSLGMSPNATTWSAARPSPSHSIASVLALVTPGALISTSAPSEDQVVVDEVPDEVLGARPELLRVVLLVPGQDLDGVGAEDRVERSDLDLGRQVVPLP